MDKLLSDSERAFLFCQVQSFATTAAVLDNVTFYVVYFLIYF